MSIPKNVISLLQYFAFWTLEIWNLNFLLTLYLYFLFLSLTTCLSFNLLSFFFGFVGKKNAVTLTVASDSLVAVNADLKRKLDYFVSLNYSH